MKKILPIVLVILGIGGGLAAGMFLKPDAGHPDAAGGAHDTPATGDAGHGDAGAAPGHATEGDAASADGDHGPDTSDRSYVKIGRQTIVPVVKEGRTHALMLFELALDVPAGAHDRTMLMEPRLRDAFLRVLFQMSYTGAFMEDFTDDRIIEELRQNLIYAARRYLGEDAKDVLILDVMRQEL